LTKIQPVYEVARENELKLANRPYLVLLNVVEDEGLIKRGVSHAEL
jgi:hypothetical protein